MNKKIVLSALAVLTMLPSVCFGIVFPGAPPLAAPVNFLVLIIGIASIILEATWVIAVAFVIIMFILAGFKFLTAQGDLNKVADARQAVIWGAGGVIVILLSFSILVAMRATLGI